MLKVNKLKGYLQYCSMTFKSIIGQERPIRFLQQSLKKGMVANAYLFTGIEGIGKRTTATVFAMALNCLSPDGASPCGSCRSCRKIGSGNHPDVIYLERKGAFIRIDQVRELFREISFRPFEGKKRVVIITNAHTMNHEAANALLKVLEEPPAKTTFILTASQESDLLPTIVSRCQHITFSPIPAEKIAEVLIQERGLKKEEAMPLAVCAGGSLKKALSADVKDWMDWRKQLIEEFHTALSGSMQNIFEFSCRISPDRERLIDALEVLGSWFRDVLFRRLGFSNIINKDFNERIEEASRGNSIQELLMGISAIESAKNDILKNCNRRLRVEVMMIDLLYNVREKGV
nr:DNA polymerase III subunit delta' [Desulfobacterales bacterium]